MTTYTTTEESKFETRTKSSVLATVAQTARERLASMAEKAGYPYMVVGTWQMNISLSDDGTFRATVEAVYARIVLADQPSEGDMDGEREARGPDEKDYSDLAEAPVPDPWDPL